MVKKLFYAMYACLVVLTICALTEFSAVADTQEGKDLGSNEQLDSNSLHLQVDRLSNTASSNTGLDTAVRGTEDLFNPSSVAKIRSYETNQESAQHHKRDSLFLGPHVSLVTSVPGTEQLFTSSDTQDHSALAKDDNAQGGHVTSGALLVWISGSLIMLGGIGVSILLGRSHSS